MATAIVLTRVVEATSFLVADNCQLSVPRLAVGERAISQRGRGSAVGGNLPAAAILPATSAPPDRRRLLLHLDQPMSVEHPGWC